MHFDAGGLAALQVALGLIMFGVALDLSVDDFRRLARAPRAPVIGLLSQFLLLPAAAWCLAMVLAPTPSVALGMILVAACPGGNVSNFLTQLAGGRLTVSVGMTAVSTLAAVVATPANLAFWGTRSAWTAPLVTAVALDPLELFRSVAVLLLVPVVLGMLLAHHKPTWAAVLKRWLTVLSVLFLAVVIGVAFVGNRDIFLVAVQQVFVPVAAMNAVALGLGYGAGFLAGLAEDERRALAFEVGIQNSGLGLVLVFAFFNGLGGMAVVAAWWGIWHILAGFALVTVFRLSDRRQRLRSSLQ